MKWMDVILGEVAARRDAGEVRASRRREMLDAAEACFEAAVRPVVQEFQARMREAGVDLTLDERQDVDRDVLVLRLSRVGRGHPLEPYVEFAAEPYNPFVVVWIRAPRESRPQRHEIFRMDELDENQTRRCLEVFADVLSLSRDK